MNGLKAEPNLSGADANAILQALVDRARKANEFTGDDAPANVLLRYACTRPDIAVEAVMALGKIPEARLSPGVAALLGELKQKVSSAEGVVNSQLAKFSQSMENPGLASSATSILKR